MHHFLTGTARIGLALTLCGAFLLPSAFAQIEPTGTPPDAKGWRTATVVEGIRNPWGMTWLPDGRLLITGKYGTLHMVENGQLRDIAMDGLPEVFTEGQGGLLDIALHPNFQQNQRIYLTLSTGTKDANRIILVRGTFNGQRVSNIETLFRVQPDKDGDEHFGSRLLWLPDGTMLMTIGDGGNPPRRIGDMLAREQAQNLQSHLGKILRLTEDGKPAPDNPFAGKQGVRPEIWVYGVRNIQGITREPESGRVWANEHGPRGGDELNLIEGGRNYGWPTQTWGVDYRTGEPFGEKSVEGMPDPKVVWTPAHAPSGLAYYTGDRFPQWRGSLFSGGLASEDIRRIELDGNGKVVNQDRLDIGRRVRDVRQGPDGYLYAITDEENGRLLRIEPDQGS
ncbi:MAG TPA: PQQ-dependent sugar dehydrogenase [Noviherbaspirillum sp.]|nr:PQQ-dependent sugar dehydrogenase [Noviherbaspirillum sp.]